jgi:hypothetical protein
VLSQRQKSESRKSLAEPDFRPERVLRRISRTVPGNGRTVGQAASLPDGPAQPSSLPVGRIANPSHDESKPQPAAMQ